MLHELERRILMAGDRPGVILSSTLAPGSVTGATVLVVEAKYQPVNDIVTAENSLARFHFGDFHHFGRDLAMVDFLAEGLFVRKVGYRG